MKGVNKEEQSIQQTENKACQVLKIGLELNTWARKHESVNAIRQAQFLKAVVMFLSSWQSFIVISHAKHLLRKYGAINAASYLHKNNVSFDVAKQLILGA